MKNNRKSILGTILVLLAAACWSIIGLFVLLMTGVLDRPLNWLTNAVAGGVFALFGL